MGMGARLSLKMLRRQGFSLLEILLALVILALSVMPFLDAFLKNYGVTARQVDQEIALKLAEGTMNALLSQEFSDLMVPPGGFSIPLHFEIAGTPVPGIAFPLTGSGGSEKAKGTYTLPVGKASFVLSASVLELFKGAPVGTDLPAIGVSHNYLILRYKILKLVAAPVLSDPPVLAGIESLKYIAPDSFLGIIVKVQYPSGAETKEMELFSCKANLRR